MDMVRFGVIGCGGMGQSHMRSMADLPRVKFVAASDSFEPNLKKVTEQYGVRGFADAEEMLASGLIDAVIIATPHYFHPPYAIAAMKRGVHVLTEKPVSVTVKAAEEVNAEAENHPEIKYAAMFQMRTNPRFKLAKELIESGELGPIQRVLWSITTWFRTQAYYDSGAWRATWEGEGGGVLLNQCPHNLDLLWWLTGLPNKMHAHVTLGKYHDIEVEDDVTAYMEYPNGANGVFITTTGEAPGTNYLEIIGDNGKLVIGETIEFHRTESSVKKFLQTDPRQFTSIPRTKITYEPPAPAGGAHGAIIKNLADAIIDDVPLIAPGVEGIHSVELANAMILSGLKREAVDMPIDRTEYEQLLQDLIKQSKSKKAGD